jgi:hypothetical protein
MGRVFRILKRSSHVTLELDLRKKATAPSAGKATTTSEAGAAKKRAAKRTAE